MIPMRWCRPGPHSMIKISSKLSLHNVLHHESDVSKTSSSSHKFPSHDFQVIPATSPTRQQQFGKYTSFRRAVNPRKLCLQETLHCSFGACSSRPRTSILALRIQLQRSAMDKRCEHFLFRKLSGLPTPATTLTCVNHTQPALKSGSRRSAAMQCRSIGYSGFVHSVHQSDQSFSRNRSGCLCKHATANLRAKLKSPKLSSWEDSSPSRSAANNQKCSESSSRSLSPCPLSYSNPCITSVYASHLFWTWYSAWWRPGDSFFSHSFLYFNDLKVDNTITMAPRMVSFDLVFISFQKKKGCCVPPKKGGGSALFQHSARCASKWRLPGWGRFRDHAPDGSAGSQNLYFVLPDYWASRCRRRENTSRGQAKNFHRFESHTQHLSEDETGRLQPDL